MLKYIRITTTTLLQNCYIVWDQNLLKGYIIDPGYADINKIKNIIMKKKINILGIINTHGHWDHIYNNSLLKKIFKIPILIHKNDNEFLCDSKLNLSFKYSNNFISEKADILIKNKIILSIGEEYLKVLHTPGHTPGSIILYNKNIAFTGDTLFINSIGRCDFIKGSKKDMNNSIKIIKSVFSNKILILPGHGRTTSTFEEQLKTNPYL